MDCEKRQEHISGMLDGLRSTEGDPETFMHLGSCETCREFFHSVLSVGSAIGNIHGAELSLEKDMLIREEVAQRPRPQRLKKRITFSLPAAAVFVLLMIGGLIGTSLHFIGEDETAFPATHQIQYISDFPEIEIVPTGNQEY